MLCFVFAALVVVLDQFFKQWIVLTMEIHEHIDIIPGVIELTRVQNSGAAFSMLSGQRWLLAGISLAATVVLIFILLRYTEGFWGTLGLSAILGGTVGNMIDRLFHGYVVDMFHPLFIDFAIFNIADIFLTLGFITFCIHFIVSSIRTKNHEGELEEAAIAEEFADEAGEDEAGAWAGAGDEAGTVPEGGGPYSIYDVPDRQEIPDYDDFSVAGAVSARNGDEYDDTYNESQHVYGATGLEQQDYNIQIEPELPREVSSALSELEELESELASIDDYDMDDLLKEYGFTDDTDGAYTGSGAGSGYTDNSADSAYAGSDADNADNGAGNGADYADSGTDNTD